jgi:RHH-type proline utilization regulon transcriptional repressor/proline dehydrogenase/delta 1-pyrroline-5-carboxylate dehydrogenase
MAEHDEELERAIQERGVALLATVKPERLLVLSPAWLQERLMGWASADSEFRTRLLRFVDVLPALRTSSAVADHVRQYFREGTPGVIRLGASAAGAGAFRPALSKVVRQGVTTMSDRFIGGADPEAALETLRGLVESGTGYTVDLLGEAVLSDGEADAYAQRCHELVAAIAAVQPNRETAWTARNMSVKFSSLVAHFESAAPRASIDALLPRLLPLLRAAREAGVFVNVDMEQHRFRDLTERAFSEIALSEEFRAWDGLGIVVQAYLEDATASIERIASLARERAAPLTIRLVKGAYWDEETVLARQENRPAPVFENKAATDLNYERCTDRLIAAYPHVRPAFGSHNPRSIAQAMEKADRAGIPTEATEFQMLFGMAEGLRKAVRDAGYPTRVYVPVGAILPGMAYLVRRLLENTSNESWFIHRHEEGDPRELLAPPEPEPESAAEEAPFANQTPAQFHEPPGRAAMEAALHDARSQFGSTVPLIIGGERIETSASDEVRPPADPALLMALVARAGRAEVERAVVSAKRSLEAWANEPPQERAGLLRRAADLLEERRYEFAATMVFESAKPWREADGDVIEAIDYMRYYAWQAERLFSAPRELGVPGEQSTYHYEPRGVAAVIAPWNFPLAIITGMATAALAAGCPVILKPAEQSPIVAGKLATLLLEAGFPPGVVNYTPGPGDTGKALVEHPDVAVIAFTGSNEVGQSILQAAARVAPGQRDFKHVVAEMGGKNAIIVDEDADIDQAIEGVVASAFGFAGQKCSACSRVIVVGSAYDEFRDRLAEAVASIPVGSPEDPYTILPPVISGEARVRIQEYIALGRAEGTVVATQPAGAHGFAVAPHVFEGITRDSRLAQEEIFGPVLLLFRAVDFGEAVEIALDSRFALTGGVFSRNPRNIARARRDFRVGNLYINRKITGANVGRHPFGGFGMSGLGDKAGGPDYLLEFVIPRVVTENTMRRGFAPDA